jgi:hypothetical protein
MTISWPAVRIRNCVFIDSSHNQALHRAIARLERSQDRQASLMADIDADREPLEFGYADPTDRYTLFDHEGVNFQPFGPDDPRKQRYVTAAIERGDHLPYSTVQAMRQTWARHKRGVHWYDDKVRLAGYVPTRVSEFIDFDAVMPSDIMTAEESGRVTFEFEREWIASDTGRRRDRITCQGVVIQDWS